MLVPKYCTVKSIKTSQNLIFYLHALKQVHKNTHYECLKPRFSIETTHAEESTTQLI